MDGVSGFGPGTINENTRFITYTAKTDITVNEKKYSIAMVRSYVVKEVNHSIRSVKVDGEIIWNFSNENREGTAVLIKVQSKHFVCFVSKTNQIDKMIPLDDIKNAGKYGLPDSELRGLAEIELGLISEK